MNKAVAILAAEPVRGAETSGHHSNTLTAGRIDECSLCVIIMIRIVLVSVLLSMASGQALQDSQTLPLWSGAAPGAQGTEDRDVPTITAYLPRGTPQAMTAVIICPGGSYTNLAMNHEGRQVANYLNSMGIAGFVLKYRLGPRYHHPVEIGDAQRAIRMLRSHAAEWHIAADRIGIMGFSAGGHLAASASTHFDSGNSGAADSVDRARSRPDFAILVYPVI